MKQLFIVINHSLDGDEYPRNEFMGVFSTVAKAQEFVNDTSNKIWKYIIVSTILDSTDNWIDFYPHLNDWKWDGKDPEHPEPTETEAATSKTPGQIAYEERTSERLLETTWRLLPESFRTEWEEVAKLQREPQ